MIYYFPPHIWLSQRGSAAGGALSLRCSANVCRKRRLSMTANRAADAAARFGIIRYCLA
ncbi:hypothetical protein KCP77_03880 [Salmonella enterica subsp. enterica]|nr:hypothetical protein KCP77_03880 [Salmonella enterica subsp. enterica]